VGVGVGVLDLVGDGFGVGTGGVPGHTLRPMIANGFATVVVVLEPPPPQLMISAAVKKDSTGTSTRHRRRQIIKP
jgi:DNA-binding transcriptional LysR family regulator